MSGEESGAVYSFRVSVPVDGIPAYPRAPEMWRDKRPVPEAASWLGREYVIRRELESHARRVGQAAYLYPVDLDSDACRFTSRRLTLAGTLEARNCEAAITTILSTVRWSLQTIYDDRTYSTGLAGQVRPISDVRMTIASHPTRAKSPRHTPQSPVAR